MINRRRLSLLACAFGWVASRLLLVYAIRHRLLLGPHDVVLADIQFYHDWARRLAGGHGFPVNDARWQYPPGAAVLFVSPLALPLSYRGGFIALMLLADAATFGLLVVRRKTTAGGWLWVLGGLALGPLFLARFDIVPTGLAVAGLACGAPVAAGVLLGMGGWVKVWPALLALRGTGPRPTVQRLVGIACVSAAAICVLAVGGQLDRAFDFLTQQKHRGLQVESVAATPFLLVDALRGAPFAHRFAFEYGAVEVKGPLTGTAASLCTVAGAGVLVWWCLSTVRAWRRGEAFAQSLWRALALVLLLMVTSRVLSPQYMIWALGLGGLLAAHAVRGARVMGLLLLYAAVLSQWVFPSHYFHLASRDPGATIVLGTRNLLLLSAAGLAVWFAERSGVASPERSPDRRRAVTSA